MRWARTGLTPDSGRKLASTFNVKPGVAPDNQDLFPTLVLLSTLHSHAINTLQYRYSRPRLCRSSGFGIQTSTIVSGRTPTATRDFRFILSGCLEFIPPLPPPGSSVRGALTNDDASTTATIWISYDMASLPVYVFLSCPSASPLIPPRSPYLLFTRWMGCQIAQ